MKEEQPIINIAVIAHVDAGKSTLVDALPVSYTHLDVYKRQQQSWILRSLIIWQKPCRFLLLH